MKKYVSTLMLTGLTSAFLFSGCNKPTERPSKMGDEAAAALKIADIGEVSQRPGAAAGSKRIIYSKSGEMNLAAFGGDSALEQKKLEGSAEAITNKVTNAENAAALKAHLDTPNGAIALVVLEKEVMILKVVAASSADNTAVSAQYWDAAKAISLTPAADEAAHAEQQQKMTSFSSRPTAELGEKFGVERLTSIQVKKYGVLEDERTDYGERKSITGISQVPFELSTHILLGVETGEKEEAAEPAAEE